MNFRSLCLLQLGLVGRTRTSRRNIADLAGLHPGGKFIASGAGAVHDARIGGPNRKFRLRLFQQPAGISLSRLVFLFLFGVLLVMLSPAGLYAQEFHVDDSSGSQLVSLSSACNAPPSLCSIDDGTASASSSMADASSAPADSSDENDWVHRWLRMVDKTRTLEPHYAAPLITTHVLLVQQFRYDMYWQEDVNANWTANYGASKGLEIIPNSRIEVNVGIPPYMVHQTNVPDGFGDVSLFVKFRAFSAPEGKGDYFVGAFLGASFPSGSLPNSLGHTQLTPMVAAAKGWGHFDIQSTLSGTLPASGTNVLGRSIVFNNTFQFNIRSRIWPEMEVNSTFITDGPAAGKKQTFLTPGFIFGRFPMVERVHFIIGAGMQIAVTQYHSYNHRWVLSVRFPF